RGHHRGGRLGDRAARPFEADIVDQPILQLEVEYQPVAAERVESFHGAVGRLELAEIARPTTVVDHQFLIQIAQLGAHRNSSFTLASPSTSRSTSSRVL